MAAPTRPIRQVMLKSATRIALALLGLTTVLLIWNIAAYSDTEDWTDHTREVILQTQKFLASLLDAETGQRGFLITGDERYLAPYRQATNALPNQIRTLRHLIADNARQQARLDRLETVTREKQAELGETIRIRRDQGEAAAQAIVLTDHGKAAMDEIRSLASEMETQEYELLGSRIKLRRHSTVRIAFASCASGALGLALLLLAQGNKRRAEIALRQSEERLRLTLSQRDFCPSFVTLRQE